MQRILRLALLLTTVIAGAALTACNRPGQESVGQKVDGSIADAKVATAKAADALASAAKDIAITAKVNAALAADNSLKAMSVDVDTKDGRVALRGIAPDAASRERAKAVVNAIDGVVTVDNLLVVGK